MTAPADTLSPKQRAILRLLLSNWLRGTPAGRAILAETPEPLAIDLLLELQAEGRCRFVTFGDLDQDGFGFAVEGLPGPEPLRAAAARRTLH